MHTISRNSEISETSNLLRLLVNVADKIRFKWIDKYVSTSNLSMCYTRKNIRES